MYSSDLNPVKTSHKGGVTHQKVALRIHGVNTKLSWKNGLTSKIFGAQQALQNKR